MITRTQYSLFSPLLAALMMFGCASTPAVRLGSTVVAFEDVVATSDRQSEVLRSLQAEGNLQIESPSFSQSASFAVTMRRPDSLQLDFRGPFGIRVGSALITRSSLQFYNSLQNRLYTGDMSPDNLEKTVNLALTFDDMLSMFSGGAVLTPDRGASYTIQKEGSDAVFLFKDGTYQRRYVVDPATRTIRKLQVLNKSGAPIGEQAFGAFDTVGDITYPRRITLTQHEARRRLTLYYESVQWNPEVPPEFTFSVPSNAERVEIR